MGYVALADGHLLKYLQKFDNPAACTVGLIVGQPLGEKTYILHLAKTSSTHDDHNDEEEEEDILSIEEISEMAISEHAKHTTRMLSGGMYVLGVFVVHIEDVIAKHYNKVTSILRHVHKRLGKNHLNFGNYDNIQKMFLQYNPIKKTHSAYTFYIESGRIEQIEFKFLEKRINLCMLECKFEINETIPIIEKQIGLPLKQQIRNIIIAVNNCLQQAIYLYNGEMATIRDLRQKRDVTLGNSEAIQVSILFPTHCSTIVRNAEVMNAVGFLRLNGMIASTIWIHSKASYKLVSQAVHEDIIRSLTSRLGMHFDSLTEGEGGFLNDSSSIHEPPRRVFICIPNIDIMLSDYLFPGEGCQDAQQSFQDILDIPITSKLPVKDIEGQADLAEYYEMKAAEEEVLPQLRSGSNRLIYVLGGGIAILVLIVSLFIHYVTE